MRSWFARSVTHTKLRCRAFIIRLFGLNLRQSCWSHLRPLHMSANSFIVRRGTAADVEDILRIEHAALRGHSRLFPGMVSDPAGFMLYEVSIIYNCPQCSTSSRDRKESQIILGSEQHDTVARRSGLCKQRNRSDLEMRGGWRHVCYTSPDHHGRWAVRKCGYCGILRFKHSCAT